MSLTWKLEFRKLDLKYTWAISRNAADYKINGFITVTDGKETAYGEIAPNIRYKESPEEFEALFNRIVFPEFYSLEEFTIWLKDQKLPNALRFGIESAFIHYLAQKKRQSVAAFLGLEERKTFPTSYTIPIMPEEALSKFCKENNLNRFSFIKVKVNAVNLVPFVQEINKNLNCRLIIDANEAYTDPDLFIKDLEKIGHSNIELIEQPFPATVSDEFVYLKKNINIPVFADESITDSADFDKISQEFDGVNIKLMKAGGYLNAVYLLKEARARGLKTMIGCMVETSLGISSAFYLASLADYLDLDSFLILKEDPFKLMLEKEGTLFLRS